MSDRRVAMWVVGGVFVGILLFMILGPKRTDDDPEPTTYNSGTQGAKAAYLVLGELGYRAERWESPVGDLGKVDAAKTTLILTAPRLPVKGLKDTRGAIEDFLKRGGRVVATGRTGALLLPDGATEKSSNVYDALCHTTPQGAGELARAGKVEMDEPVRWGVTGAAYKVEQRCGADAVVVRFRVGEGEAVWWSSAMPLTNAGLSEDASLKLLLASVGPVGRRVLFDEYLHTFRESVTGTLKGLPWWALVWQLVAAGVVLLLSRSRRSGPLRTVAVMGRTSPIEFAQSMGQLYGKAGATQAATEAARGRLVEFLREGCGVPGEVLRTKPVMVGRVLAERFGGDWSEVDGHLEQAESAAGTALATKSALKLVQSLDGDVARLRESMKARAVVNR